MAVINGGNDDETLAGTTDDDTITGGAGNDSITGGDGNDVIFGDDGDQSLPDGSLVFVDTFDAGAGNWTSGTVDNSEPAFGTILGPLTGTSASGDVETSTSLTFDPAYDDAVIEFTFHRIDTWDNEDFEIFSDGQMIFSQTFDTSTAVGQSQVTTIGGSTYTVTLVSDGDAAQKGYWANGQTWTYDQSFSVRIEVENAPTDFELGFGSTLNQPDFYDSVGAFDETYGLDNFSVVSTNDTSLDITAFTASDDRIDGGSGDDIIYGEEGDDVLFGGTGNDTLFGGDGADAINGGDDADTIHGSSGDKIDGGEGGVDNDTLIIADADAIVTYATGNPENGTVTFSDSTTLTFTNIENVVIPCFASGTHIQTKSGNRLVEDLEVDDLVQTLDNGYQAIRWTGARTLDAIDLAANPRLKPIRINAGALGPNLPDHDLLVSPQHRVLVRSIIAKRIFGETEILVAAKKLLDLDGINIANDLSQVTYHHFLFERHEVVFSNSAPTESLFTGKEALKAVGVDAKKEIETLFPEILEDDYMPIPARQISHKGKQISKMAQRLQKNRKFAVETRID